MQSRELAIGRTFGVTFDHGEDFFDALSKSCTENGVRQAFIPSFIAGFAEAEVVGTCEKLANPKAPVWWSKVHLENAEVLGGGTIAYDDEAGEIRPHIHIAVGFKERAATGYTSHLLSARVQFLEMLVVEVAAPLMRRPRNPELYDVPLLTFD